MRRSEPPFHEGTLPAAVQEVLEERGYASLKYLTKGGFGSVFSCGESLALKFAYTKANEAGGEEPEWLLLSRLSGCENVLHLYDYFVLQLVPSPVSCFVTELCIGDLSHMVQERWAKTAYALEHGGLTAARLRDFGSQLVNGLAFIHSKNIIHRDLKCGNVLVAKGASGRLLLKISDLGISKDVPEGADAPSGPHTNIGTPRYKAPEVHGSARPAYSGRADIYSLGLVLADVASQELWHVRLGKQEMMHDHRTMPCMQCLDDAVRATATASPHLAVLADGMLRIPTGERMELAAAANVCASEPSPLCDHVSAAEALLRQVPLPPPPSCISAVQTLSRLSVAAGMEELAVSCLAQLQRTNSRADPDTLTAVVQALSSLAVQKTELTRHAAWLPAVLDVAANKRVAEDVRIIAVNTLDVLTWDEAESMEVLLPSTGEEMGVMSAALLLTKLRHDPFSRVSVAADRVMKCWQ